MKTLLQSFSVAFEYPVIFTDSLWQADSEILLDTFKRDSVAQAPYRALVVVDQGLATKQPQLIKQITAWFEAHAQEAVLIQPVWTLPGGEKAKSNHKFVLKLINTALREGIGRKDFIIAVGGGAVQDAVGFAAALIHRGCHTIRVNSTTLAQDDAGVGVKNGVDVASFKNFVGTFAPPFAVINDASLLTTLSDLDWIGGVSEAVKVSILKSEPFFGRIQALSSALVQRDALAMQEVIYECARLHLQQIATSGDAFERGNARPLDFGHWAAHRLEAMSCYALTHGMAVAIGIALDSVYAWKKGLLSEGNAIKILNLLESLNLPIYAQELTLRGADGVRSVLTGLRQFKEHLGGALCITLPTDIGAKVEVNEMDLAILDQAIDYLEAHTR